MALRIRIEHGQDAGKTWRLGVPGTYRFGRNAASSVQVLDMKVSKDHFEIAFADGVDATIRDLESSHGTLLNGQPVTHAGRPLVAGDEIRVGLTVLRVLSDGAADAEAEVKGPPPAAAPASAAVDGAAPGGTPAGVSPAAGDTTARRTTGSGSLGGGSVGGVTPQTGGGARPAGDTTARRQASLPPDALVGQTLAGYKILEKVGAGGMGAVYRAEQLSLHREVALKVLAEKLVSDSAFVDQFLNEARAAGQLNHPNVVQVYDVGQAEGRHFFSMEYIHGGSVESRIPRGGKGIPWTDALSWFLDAANALVFAERKGILHRDIKPDNFMLSQDGSAKLCDLGLAKKSESDDLLAQGIIGTPHFISPEAIRRRTDVDKRSDLYSLGCTFYKVLTGKNPYPLGSVKEILLAHLNAPVPHVSALAAEVPKELDEIVFKLMQKEPKDRFEDAAVLWTALDKVRLQHGMAAHGLHPGRAKKVAILVTVVALAAVGFAVKKIMEPKEKGDTVVVEKPPTEDPANAQLLQSAKRDKAWLGLENDELRLRGDFSQKEAWTEMARKWDEFAKDWEGTDKAEDAKRRAAVIRGELKKYDDAAAKHATDLAECCNLVDGRRSQATAEAATLRKDGKLLEAEKVLQDARTFIAKHLDLKDAKGQPFYDPAKGKKVQDELAGLIEELGNDVTKAWNPVKDEAEKLKDLGTVEDLEKAKDRYETWLQEHPVPEMTVRAQSPVVGGKLTQAGEAAKTRIDEIEKAVADLRAQQLLMDNREHFTLLRSTYRPQFTDVRGGWYAEFEAGTAVTAFQTAAAKAQTVEFKELETRSAAEAQKASQLVGRLAKAFADKPWKDPIQGNGWKGPIQEVRPDAVKVGNQERFFRNEGPAFLVELFYDPKGQERFPLTADEHEGLAVLAEAAGITFDGPAADVGKPFERAQKEFERAATLDPARADRLKRRIEQTAQESGARRLFLESVDGIEKAEGMMKALEDKLQNPDKKVRDAAPKEVSEKEKEIGALIQAARQKIDELQSKYPGTRTRAILSDAKDKAPDGARYAGVDVPAEKPEPAPADSPINTPPSGNGSAMGDGAAGGMDGAAPTGPGMDAPPPVPKEPAPAGMDAPR